MPPDGSLPIDVLLQDCWRDAEEFGADEAAGRDLFGYSVLRCPPDGPDASQGRTLGQSEANRPADAEDGPGGGISASEHEPSPPGTQDLPVPAPGRGDHESEPGVVRGRHEYSDAPWVPLPRGDYGLA